MLKVTLGWSQNLSKGVNRYILNTDISMKKVHNGLAESLFKQLAPQLAE